MTREICDKCGEYDSDCKCDRVGLNYFMNPGMGGEVKVWAQMFFNDGSVTQGKYIPRSIFDYPTGIEELARRFLDDTGRKEGVLFIWGAGRVYAQKAQLFLSRRGTLKGRQTLRLRNL